MRYLKCGQPKLRAQVQKDVPLNRNGGRKPHYPPLSCEDSINMENLPSDHFVTAQQFVKTVYRDVYPAIDPAAPSNNQAGKVIVITGASKGIGRKVFAERMQ